MFIKIRDLHYAESAINVDFIRSVTLTHAGDPQNGPLRPGQRMWQPLVAIDLAEAGTLTDIPIPFNGTPINREDAERAVFNFFRALGVVDYV